MMEFGKETRVKFAYGELFFRVDGLEPAITMLDNMIRRSQNLANPFQLFQKYWFEAIEENFQDEGNPTPWPDYSDAYRKWKTAHYPGNPMMVLSGDLKASVTDHTSDTIWRVGPRHIEFGSRIPYFDYHQEGRGRNKWRPVIVLPSWAQNKLTEMVTDFVNTGRAE